MKVGKASPMIAMDEETQRVISEIVAKYPFLGDEEEVLEKIVCGDTQHDAAGNAIRSIREHLSAS